MENWVGGEGLTNFLSLQHEALIFSFGDARLRVQREDNCHKFLSLQNGILISVGKKDVANVSCRKVLSLKGRKLLNTSIFCRMKHTFSKRQKFEKVVMRKVL